MPRGNRAQWTFRPLLAALAACLALTADAATAQASEWESRSGVYVHTGGDVGERIDEAIEQATEGMRLVRRRVAQRKLDEANHAYQEFRVAFGESMVRMLINGSMVALPVSGKMVQTQSPEGRTVQGAVKLQGNSMVQRFHGKRGTRTHRFRWLDADTVRVTVEIDSPFLPDSVSYRLRYERKD